VYINIFENIILGEPKNVIQDDPVVRPRPEIRVQNNRSALRRNNRNVIGMPVV